MTAVIGSYPKPDYVYPGNARRLLDDCGRSLLEFEERIGKQEFKKQGIDHDDSGSYGISPSAQTDSMSC